MHRIGLRLVGPGSAIAGTLAVAAAGLAGTSPPPCACSAKVSVQGVREIHYRRLFSSNAGACTNNSTGTLATPPQELQVQDQQQHERPLRNSVLLIPNVLSPDECDILRREADRLLDDGNGGGSYRRDRFYDETDEEDLDDNALRRVSVCDMSSDAREISNRLIKERVLPAMQRQAPDILRGLGLEGWESTGFMFDWASDEPSVNRYTTGGQFEPHRDGYPLTVVLLLSKDGAFTGGGTKFFETSSTYSGESKEKSVIVQPPQGSALCFDGEITHAGSPVISGTRHLFVASFGKKHTQES